MSECPGVQARSNSTNGVLFMRNRKGQSPFHRSACSSSIATLVVLSSAPFGCISASAQEVTSAGGEIVVTAQKREEKLQNVPISIAVISGKSLDRQPTGGTLEALRQVPGLSQTSTSIGNATQLTIRGVAPAGQFLNGSATVGYYIDSIPFGLVKSAVVPDTNAYDMERIEVLRGPQGTLYGASALNGVVRLITHDADPTQFAFKARGGASITKGGAPGLRADAAVNLPVIEDKLAVRLVGGVESLGGWIDQPLRGKDNANNSLSRNLRVKVDARPSDNLRIDLTAWISRQKDDAASYADNDGNQSTPLATPQSTRYDAYSGKITYDLPFVSISSATSYLKMRRTSYTDYSVISPTAQLYSDMPSRVFTEEFLLNSTGKSSWRWSAGAFYRKAHDDLYQYLPGVTPLPLYFRDQSESIAVFGQVTKTFLDNRLELSAGLRYFHDKVTQRELANQAANVGEPLIAKTTPFHAVTPRAVLTWLPSSSLTAYASYSEGFRSGFNQTPLALLAAPDLPPVNADKLHNYEAGVKGTLLGGLASYEAALFYIKWNDVQQTAQVLYNGVYIGAAINGPSASGLGTDVSLTLHSGAGFDLGGSVSWSGLNLDDAVTSQGAVAYDKGDRLAYSAKYTASAFANYAMRVSDMLEVRFNLSANYHSAMTTRTLSRASSAVASSDRPLIINGSITLADDQNRSISLYVQNLTNWNGLMQPAVDEQNMFRLRPRTIGFQFDASF